MTFGEHTKDENHEETMMLMQFGKVWEDTVNYVAVQICPLRDVLDLHHRVCSVFLLPTQAARCL
ncbi:hypothetical protein E2C01_073864 [Portunus trituberculatus]|uniref:Uncharacterized protein n=1 Tax=Portunus trituberculatus TaxID=210409 RepID=A0A5B7I1V5_PORTR|nr:hypothetical protein [Portunus trituberculatus]